MMDFPGEFYLDDESLPEITGTPDSITFPRWMQIAHCVEKRTSLILVAGERLIVEASQIENDTHLYVRFGAGLPEISKDGLVLDIVFSDDGQKRKGDLIASLSIKGGEQTPYWREIDIDLSFLTARRGNLQFYCSPGEENDPCGDWLAIADLCVARKDRLSLMKARSFHAMRSQNEIEHFSQVYRHSLYSQVQEKRAAIAEGRDRPLRKLAQLERADGERRVDLKNSIEPLPHEPPYTYGSRLLYANIDQPIPDFIGRLKIKSKDGAPLKILSLCSGAARKEADFAAHTGPNVEWSLLDINPDLLGLASKQFESTVKLDLIEADVNHLTYSGEKWDIIICVSALHHVVELEKLMMFCHHSLNPKGEFWSIGEFVGRNGNRLWPDTKDVANEFFKKLPEKYRMNRDTGRVDQEIPDNDCSVGCFEGIRSEDIESVLDHWFKPLEIFRRNCFLWRLLNLAYCDNYDIEKPEDREWIDRIVEAELDHFLNGGVGTELYGIFIPK